MKQYESPVVQQVDDITEGIYVASGASPTPVPTPIPTDVDYRITCNNGNQRTLINP